MDKFVFDNCETSYETIAKEFETISEELVDQNIYPVDVQRVDNQVHITLNKPYRGSNTMVTEIDFSAVTAEDGLVEALQKMRLRLAYGWSQFDLQLTEGQGLQEAKDLKQDFPNKEVLMDKLHQLFHDITVDECTRVHVQP